MQNWHQISIDLVPYTEYRKNIGFQAHTVVIDNYTPVWIYVPDANQYVPPYTAGFQVPLFHTTDYGYVTWVAPPGVPNPTPVGDTKAHITWVAVNLGYSAGYSVTPQSVSPTKLSGQTVVTPLPAPNFQVLVASPGPTKSIVVTGIGVAGILTVAVDLSNAAIFEFSWTTVGADFLVFGLDTYKPSDDKSFDPGEIVGPVGASLQFDARGATATTTQYDYLVYARYYVQ